MTQATNFDSTSSDFSEEEDSDENNNASSSEEMDTPLSMKTLVGHLGKNASDSSDQCDTAEKEETPNSYLKMHAKMIAVNEA